MKNTLIKALLIILVLSVITSCSSILRYENDTTTQSDQITTPVSSIITTPALTTPPWSTQTGQNIVETHPGYVGSTYYDKAITDQSGKVVAVAKMNMPDVVFYENDNLQAATNETLSVIKSEIEYLVNRLCNAYLGSEPDAFISIPLISSDFELTYYTKNAMSLKFTLTHVDSSGVVNKSHFGYTIDLTTGARVDISTIFKNHDLSGITSSILNKLGPSYDLYDSAFQIIQTKLSSAWYISSTGLNFCFNAQDIAPLTQGNIEVNLEPKDFESLLSSYGIIIFTKTTE